MKVMEIPPYFHTHSTAGLLIYAQLEVFVRLALDASRLPHSGKQRDTQSSIGFYTAEL